MMNQSALKVLVVDDDHVVRMSLASFFEDEGFTVKSSQSAEEALELLDKENFDVGIIDIRLPGMDGNMLILKAHETRPAMKFLIHTGSTEYALPDPLKDMGIKNEHVFLKPLVDMELMVKSVLSISGR